MSLNNTIMRSLEKTSKLFVPPWASNDRQPIILPNNTGGVPLVASGGGFVGPGHIGWRRRLKELDIKLGPQVGCSIGMMDVLMAQNGFTEDESVDAYVNALSDPDMQSVLQWLVVPAWKPGLAMLRKVAQLLPVIRALPAAEGNTSVITGLLECLGLIDVVPFWVEWVKRHNIQPTDDTYGYAFDLIHWELVIFKFKAADQGKPGEQERIGRALAAAAAVPGFVRPVSIIDETGKSRLCIDGGMWHDGNGRLFEEPALVSALLDIKGMRKLQPHDPKDIVTKTGMSGAHIAELPSPEKVRARVEFGYQRTVENEKLNRLVREGKLPLND